MFSGNALGSISYEAFVRKLTSAFIDDFTHSDEADRTQLAFNALSWKH
jgi:hypothetical protein